jgi:hypothetical protein
MKNLRIFLAALAIAATGLVSGCATAGHDAYVALPDGSGLEKKQPATTADMPAIEKVGYYAGWYSLVCLYAFAGGNGSFEPPP